MHNIHIDFLYNLATHYIIPLKYHPFFGKFTKDSNKQKEQKYYFIRSKWPMVSDHCTIKFNTFVRLTNC